MYGQPLASGAQSAVLSSGSSSRVCEVCTPELARTAACVTRPRRVSPSWLGCRERTSRSPVCWGIRLGRAAGATTVRSARARSRALVSRCCSSRLFSPLYSLNCKGGLTACSRAPRRAGARGSPRPTRDVRTAKPKEHRTPRWPFFPPDLRMRRGNGPNFSFQGPNRALGRGAIVLLWTLLCVRVPYNSPGHGSLGLLLSRLPHSPRGAWGNRGAQKRSIL